MLIGIRPSKTEKGKLLINENSPVMFLTNYFSSYRKNGFLLCPSVIGFVEFKTKLIKIIHTRVQNIT